MIQKAVFFDRDGVINVDYGYVSTIHDFQFTNGIFPVMRSLQERHYALIIITNQSGIGRGYYSELDFQVLTKWMLKQFEGEKINIDGIYYCPHSPEERCSCRKPKAGMILQAIQEHRLSLSGSWMVGDKKSDMLAAERAGIKNRVLLGGKASASSTFNMSVIEDLLSLIPE